MKNHTVAWCASCSASVADAEARTGGDGRPSCPTCGEPLSSRRGSPVSRTATVAIPGVAAAPAGTAGAVERGGAVGDGDDEEPIKAPWHFKVLVVGTAGYLVYRLIWLIFWLTGHAWHG